MTHRAMVAKARLATYRRAMRLLFLLLTVALLSACVPRSSDEEQIRKLIDSVEQAAEARNTSAVLAFVASDYRDAQGFDKARLQNFLRGYFYLHEKVELVVLLGEFDFPSEGKATVEVTVARIELTDPERVRLQVEFRREGSKWQVTRADRVER